MYLAFVEEFGVEGVPPEGRSFIAWALNGLPTEP
jgi:hypothetical protein